MSKDWWKAYKQQNPNFLTNVYYGVQSTISTCQHCHLVAFLCFSHSKQTLVRSVFNTLYVSLPEPQSQITLTILVESLAPEAAARGRFTVQWASLSVDVDDHSRLADLLPAIYDAAGIAPDVAASVQCVFMCGTCGEMSRFITEVRLRGGFHRSTRSWSRRRC